MVERENPKPETVSDAGRALRSPQTVTQRQVRDMAGRILSDQKNDPVPHRLVIPRPTFPGSQKPSR